MVISGTEYSKLKNPGYDIAENLYGTENTLGVTDIADIRGP